MSTTTLAAFASKSGALTNGMVNRAAWRDSTTRQMTRSGPFSLSPYRFSAGFTTSLRGGRAGRGRKQSRRLSHHNRQGVSLRRPGPAGTALRRRCGYGVGWRPHRRSEYSLVRRGERKDPPVLGVHRAPLVHCRRVRFTVKVESEADTVSGDEYDENRGHRL